MGRGLGDSTMGQRNSGGTGQQKKKKEEESDVRERELVGLRQVQTRADGAGGDALMPRLFSTIVFSCWMAVRTGIGRGGGLGRSTEN